MTNEEINAEADGMLLHLKRFEPADAMMVLTILTTKAIWAATPNHIGALDQSVKLFFEEVVNKLAVATHGGVQ